MRSRTSLLLLAPSLFALVSCEEASPVHALKPALRLGTRSLDFGSVPLGATKRIALEVESIGDGTLELSDLQIALPFQAEILKSSLLPSEKGVIDVAFTPRAVGTATGSFSFRSNDASQAEITIALVGDAVRGTVSAAPSEIDWRGTPVGVRATSRVSVISSGLEPVNGRYVLEGFLRPEHVRLSADHFELTPGGRGPLEVEYRPVAAGPDRGRLRVEYCGERCGVEIPIQGSALDAFVRFMPLPIDFGVTNPGAERTQIAVLSNGGQQPLEITSVGIKGSGEVSYQVDAALPKTLAAGQSLAVTLRWAPRSTGTLDADVVATTSLPDLPSVGAPLSGRAVDPELTVTPSAIEFGAVSVAQRRSLLLINTGQAGLTVNGLSIQGSSELTLIDAPSVPAQLGAGESMTVNVAFAALSHGTHSATITVESSAGTALLVPVRALFADRACFLSASPAAIRIESVVNVDRSMSSVVRNIGNDTCRLTGAAFAAPPRAISLTSTAVPSSLAPGASMTLSFNYRPQQVDSEHATFRITTDDPTFRALAITVDGAALGAGRCFQVTPSSVDFGNVPLGSSGTVPVTITNRWTASCSIRSVTLGAGGSLFQLTSAPTPITVAAGTSAVVLLGFTPQTTTVATTKLLIDTDDPIAPHFEVPVRGVNERPALCVTPRYIALGQVPSADARVTLNGCGNRPVTVLGLRLPADREFNFVGAPQLPLVVNPGDNVSVVVHYEDLDQLGDTIKLRVSSTDFVEPEIDVTITAGGRDVVPPEAGRFLYFWQIDSAQGSIRRQELQGGLQTDTFWGAPQHSCTGCHSVSPDGKYVALIEGGFNLRIIEAVSGQERALPRPLATMALYLSWRPDNMGGDYPFAYGDGTDIHLASLARGEIGLLAGASDPAVPENMPAWGPNGEIVFVSGAGGGSLAFSGPTELMRVNEGGGVPSPLLPGATPALRYYPHFAPNGRWVAFTESMGAGSSFAAPDAQIRLVASTSGPVLPLSQLNVGASSYPTWSVDSHFLSFSSRRPGSGGWDLYVAAIDPLTGADNPATPIAAANTPEFEHAAQWSP